MTLVDRYNTLPEWSRWIFCWPVSFAMAVLCSWSFLFFGGFLDEEFMRSFIIGVVHPPLCQAIFLVCIYLTIPRAKLAVLLTFIILRSLVLALFIVSAGVTLLGLNEAVTFDTGYCRATLGEVVVLLVSVSLWKFLWKEARGIQGDEK